MRQPPNSRPMWLLSALVLLPLCSITGCSTHPPVKQPQCYPPPPAKPPSQVPPLGQFSQDTDQMLKDVGATK